MDPEKVGIYFNAGDKTLVRITSPYWIPEAPAWVMVSSDPNAPISALRDVIKTKGLVTDPSSVIWGKFPVRE